jgi:hypothetical protein
LSIVDCQLPTVNRQLPIADLAVDTALVEKIQKFGTA